MRTYESLTLDEKRQIVFERINSIVSIQKENLQTLINPEVLSNHFEEFSPIVLGHVSIGTAIALSGNDPAGILQQMYLHTYNQNGTVKFGYSETLDRYLMYFDFVNYPNTHFFNKENRVLTVDGKGGLRHCRIVQVTNLSSLKLLQMPSLCLVVKRNGNIEVNRSLVSFVTGFQYNPEVAIVNGSFNDFDSLEISIVDNSNNHDFSLGMAYK